ncbi:MAG: accessory gene regulator B family protein [Lachnospiraceae bacterium]|nr:accessory gene regulator B family protein [Lachnospiraceae bacterium]
MKKIAEILTRYVIKFGGVSEEMYEVYQYGFQIGLEMSSCFLVCLAIAVYLHMFLEFIVFSAIFILLRSYAGGAHLKGFASCFMCSVAVQTGTLLLHSRIVLPMPVAAGSLLLCGFLIYVLAPVEHVNRRLDEDEKKLYKKKTLFILCGVLIFSAVCSMGGRNDLVSLAALSLFVVFVSQIAGVLIGNMHQ